ncbi:MAG TPA: rhodanese-like domain-containing protein [Rhizomicrobium sp.]|jgi:rhodanese-related sulfurtransferase
MAVTSSNTQARRYAGDVSPKEAWDLLVREPRAQLVDVRTAAEWTFVGLPDLAALGREPLLLEWQGFPDPRPNPGFVAQATERLRAASGEADAPVLFLCRSGGRSRAAAIAMTGAGFGQALNVAGGFEGDADALGHRGASNGWKAAGLPWRQS